MDAEIRKRMELRAEWQERLTLGDTKYADEHRQAASDIRTTLAEIDRLQLAARTVYMADGTTRVLESEGHAIAYRQGCAIEIDRLTQQRNTMRSALLEIDRRIREGTGAIRCTLNQFPTPATTDEWKHNIYGSAIHAQIAAHFDDAMRLDLEITRQEDS